MDRKLLRVSPLFLSSSSSSSSFSSSSSVYSSLCFLHPFLIRRPPLRRLGLFFFLFLFTEIYVKSSRLIDVNLVLFLIRNGISLGGAGGSTERIPSAACLSIICRRVPYPSTPTILSLATFVWRLSFFLSVCFFFFQIGFSLTPASYRGGGFGAMGRTQKRKISNETTHQTVRSDWV